MFGFRYYDELGNITIEFFDTREERDEVAFMIVSFGLIILNLF